MEEMDDNMEEMGEMEEMGKMGCSLITLDKMGETSLCLFVQYTILYYTLYITSTSV